jgi:folate-binding protein YgfZ
MGTGYQALRESTASLDFSARGRIFLLGEDRVRLLHAMTTNHIQQLRAGDGCYAFFLNPQGRILADVNVLMLEDRVLLDVEPETRESVYQHLDKYIIADDVTLEDASENWTAVGLEGPSSPEALFAIGAPIPDAPFSHAQWKGRIVARVNATGSTGFRIFAPKDDAAALAAEIVEAGIVPADEESTRVVRLEHARPRYGEDILDTTLPQETQQMHALHFSKGCYLGQEIVERIRSRGRVNRLLMGLRFDWLSTDRPALAPEVGEITSWAFSPALGKTVALAYLRAQYAAAGTSVKVGESEAITTPPAVSPEADRVPTAGY